MDKLAVMVQHGFESMDKKVDERFDHVEEDIRILRNDMEAGFQTLTAAMKSLTEQINLIHEELLEMHDFRVRLERLEKKVGLRR